DGTSGRFPRQPTHLIRRDRSPEALELQLTGGLGVDHRLDPRVDALSDEHLPGGGAIAETGREVGHRAERTVVVATLEADPSQGGVAGLDPNPQVEEDAALPPSRGHRREAL